MRLVPEQSAQVWRLPRKGASRLPILAADLAFGLADTSDGVAGSAEGLPAFQPLLSLGAPFFETTFSGATFADHGT